MTSTDLQERTRRLRNAVEPVAAGVYFAPEASPAYEALGFDPSPPAAPDGIVRPELKSYFTSRGGCMGQVTGPVVAAAFGVFNPKVVNPAVDAGWKVTDRVTILAARERVATDMLRRVLGDEPDGLARATALLRRAAAAPWAGHPIYGGLRSLGFPGTPLGDLWRAADLVREHRGDSHVLTWTVGGVDAVEILLLTEQWWGLPARSYAPTRGWTDADMDAGFKHLEERGLMTSNEQLTDAGRAFREEIEIRTDELERPLLEALGDDVDELLDHLDAWSQAIIDAGSYPPRVAGIYSLGGGPHIGSGLTIDTAAEQFGR